jgi:hypothetical protein
MVSSVYRHRSARRIEFSGVVQILPELRG